MLSIAVRANDWLIDRKEQLLLSAIRARLYLRRMYLCWPVCMYDCVISFSLARARRRSRMYASLRAFIEYAINAHIRHAMFEVVNGHVPMNDSNAISDCNRIENILEIGRNELVTSFENWLEFQNYQFKTRFGVYRHLNCKKNRDSQANVLISKWNFHNKKKNYHFIDEISFYLVAIFKKIYWNPFPSEPNLDKQVQEWIKSKKLKREKKDSKFEGPFPGDIKTASVVVVGPQFGFVVFCVSTASVSGSARELVLFAHRPRHQRARIVWVCCHSRLQLKTVPSLNTHTHTGSQTGACGKLTVCWWRFVRNDIRFVKVT